MHINLKIPFPAQEMSLHYSLQLLLLRAALAEEMQQAGVGIHNSSSIPLPEPILCCCKTWAASCETGTQMTWKENLAALKSMVEVSFSSAEPGFHSWQLPSCCLYGIVFLLKSVDLGWQEAVSPGIVSVT